MLCRIHRHVVIVVHHHTALRGLEIVGVVVVETTTLTLIEILIELLIGGILTDIHVRIETL